MAPPGGLGDLSERLDFIHLHPASSHNTSNNASVQHPHFSNKDYMQTYKNQPQGANKWEEDCIQYIKVLFSFESLPRCKIRSIKLSPTVHIWVQFSAAAVRFIHLLLCILVCISLCSRLTPRQGLYHYFYHQTDV